MSLRIRPVTPERFDDVAALFGPNGANSGCWRAARGARRPGSG
jgi:hypothetical protein